MWGWAGFVGVARSGFHRHRTLDAFAYRPSGRGFLMVTLVRAAFPLLLIPVQAAPLLVIPV
jgi:hypothetical protein